MAGFVIAYDVGLRRGTLDEDLANPPPRPQGRARTSARGPLAALHGALPQDCLGHARKDQHGLLAALIRPVFQADLAKPAPTAARPAPAPAGRAIEGPAPAAPPRPSTARGRRRRLPRGPYPMGYQELQDPRSGAARAYHRFCGMGRGTNSVIAFTRKRSCPDRRKGSCSQRVARAPVPASPVRS